MAGKALSLKCLVFFFSKILLRKLTNQRSLHRNSSNALSSHSKLQRYPSLQQRSTDLSNKTIMFDVEGALFKSPCLFTYFMLVAFESGGLLRALILLFLYPLLCLFDEETSLQIMVMVCFCGIKEKSFRVGTAVLPKFLFEEVGLEGFEMVMRGGRKVGVSGLPRVMIEGFLREYLGIDVVVGRELKVVKGYYVGLMEDRWMNVLDMDKIFGDDKIMGSDVIGIGRFNKLINHQLFSHCKEIYMMSKADKRSWNSLPKEKYPKPLIFHDGRLAIKPTHFNTLAIFMWVPFALFLALIRIILALTLPHKIGNPILFFCGLRLKAPLPPNSNSNPRAKGVLYVCNHRTLLDPLYLSAVLNNKHIVAVTYSLSRISEMFSPIKTVRLTRNRDQDAKMMETLLRKGGLVICPEGTTCREPYLLRFSPLFAEMSDHIVPVAMNVHVSMFYGTTASGLKCLDPLFFFMNPFPSYKVKFLDKISGTHDSGESISVANQVQEKLGEDLGFTCTKLSRKDKYLILAGNDGIVKGEVACNS